ncbi:MAG: hypothetical protein VXY91_02330 [Bacteroidota bacterium]|nr:hypothetical protein [Bacteroidota bacterium]
MFAKNRSELVQRAKAEIDFLLQKIPEFNTPSVISLGSGVCWHEILLSQRLEHTHVIATTHISDDVKVIRDHLQKNFQQNNLSFEKLDLLKPNKNIADLSNGYTLLICGIMAPFENNEIIEFVKFMAPDNIIVICKDGEYMRPMSVMKSFIYYLLSVISGQELIKMGYFRSKGEIYKIFNEKCGYKLKCQHQMPIKSVGGRQQLFQFIARDQEE